MKEGIGLGSVIAFIISYRKWHSILWALLHGCFGWWYVLYYVFAYAK
ncbi:hypothetical protein JZO70_13445 [Enterococcus sp. 669A]|mgnify:CR=1 FL=1|uniref:Uncharacterized protein n=1 Tax=Candidatus Enterococcus moelleringii TaxID=2815325 RepID=A0ABS3LC12_9ENTE|nr:hypothetical protein [Enterococcus sp. 669A]MBO1307176.1 hypothetical protein [Enterococcus sp. 669A]